MIKNIVVSAVLIMSFTPHPAAAASAAVPRYDVKAACSAMKTAATLGGCYKAEQAAFNSLKASWSELDHEIRVSCQQVATASGPASYALLQGCVEIQATPEPGSMRAEFEGGGSDDFGGFGE